MINSTHKMQILTENAKEADENNLREYAENQAENDPNFFRWLFDESFDDDFNMSLSDDQKQEYESFLASL